MMKKLEYIYRELLYQAIEKKQRRFVQKELANLFHCSLSTVSHALEKPRQMGAVKIGGRFGEITDTQKLLFYWATIRKLNKEIVYETSIQLSPLEIETQMPPETIYGAYSAFRLTYKITPADYDQVYVYHPKPFELKSRFPLQKGRANFHVLVADPYLSRYGQTTSFAQTFADIWNLPQWYGKDFSNALLEKL